MTHLFCRLGWHRLRWFKMPDQTYKPLCSRCRRTAAWAARDDEGEGN